MPIWSNGENYMKIIIPMAGSGQRFIKSGFKEIKPLINIDGKTMIERIIEIFPKDSQFIFICNKEHKDTTPIEGVLKNAAKNGNIIWIEPHKKGPVYSCLSIFDSLGDNEEVFVNYCDLLNCWDFDNFIKTVRRGNYDGALPAFRGFHPASLGDTFYAYMRTNERNELLEIREKASFTEDRMEEFASAGGYYFAKARDFKKYCKELLDKEMTTSGEYYLSIPYNFLVRDGLRVLVYELPKHIVLGTPEDYWTYMFWANYFRKKATKTKPGLDLKNTCSTIIPIAGPKGTMFFNYRLLPKPLIPVLGKPMLINALDSFPKTDTLITIFLKEYIDQFNLSYFLNKEYPNATTISLKGITEGMAMTCMKAEPFLEMDKPLLIGGYDYTLEYNEEKLLEFLNDETIDVILFAHHDHHYERRNPFEHTYLRMDKNNKYVDFISEKSPISIAPYKDYAFAGLVYFRKARLFFEAAHEMMKKERRVQGKFYVATSVNELIELGKKVVPFVVDNYVSWGKEVNLKEFEYWEEYFSDREDHEYKKQAIPII